MPSKPAANAVKHGLSSFHHMPKGREHELPPIVQALIESRRPDSPQELEIVQELAFAMWQKGEHDRLIVAEAEKLSRKAGEVFDRQTREAFEKLKADWEKDPVAHQPAMARTPEGAGHFARIWDTLNKALTEKTGLSMAMALQAVRAEGCSTSPVAIQGIGHWIMVRLLCIKKKPADFLLEWIKAEGLENSVDAQSQAGNMFNNLPESDPGANELYDWGYDRLKEWTELQQKNLKTQARQRQEFIEEYRETVMLSDEFDARMKRLHRYRVFTENRVKDANRRLENLKAAAERKAQKAEDREFRKVNQRIAISKLTEPEFERFQNLQAESKLEMEYATLNDNPEPAQEKYEESAGPEPQPAVVPQKTEIIRMPRDWRNQTAILPQVVPNKAVFSEWTDEELDDSNDFISHIATIHEKDTEWKQCLLACQIMELSRRHLERQQKKKA